MGSKGSRTDAKGTRRVRIGGRAVPSHPFDSAQGRVFRKEREMVGQRRVFCLSSEFLDGPDGCEEARDLSTAGIHSQANEFTTLKMTDGWGELAALRVPSLRSGFRRGARTPRKRLNFATLRMTILE